MIHLFHFVIICVFKDAQAEYTDYVYESPKGPMNWGHNGKA